jgi:hypothetical protein
MSFNFGSGLDKLVVNYPRKLYLLSDPHFHNTDPVRIQGIYFIVDPDFGQDAGIIEKILHFFF